ncbi:MAG: TlpA family protein disulfide reductase [Acidobacteriales bacterium]|nr:TlpA family protein disulfide reductase [Terriglobales bacterium]
MEKVFWIFVLAAGIAGISCSPSGAGPAIQGEIAPDFTFKDQSGKEHSLSQLRGKVVLVNFWATWCPPCLDEMPSMQLLQRRMDNKPFVMLALSVDSSWEPVNQFMKQNELTLPVYADFDKRISTLYGTHVFPETYILDKKGKVAYKVVGPKDWTSSEVLKFLDVLLKAPRLG